MSLRPVTGVTGWLPLRCQSGAATAMRTEGRAWARVRLRAPLGHRGAPGGSGGAKGSLQLPVEKSLQRGQRLKQATQPEAHAARGSGQGGCRDPEILRKAGPSPRGREGGLVTKFLNRRDGRAGEGEDGNLAGQGRDAA